jgi:hypothetical protein
LLLPVVGETALRTAMGPDVGPGVRAMDFGRPDTLLALALYAIGCLSFAVLAPGAETIDRPGAFAAPRRIPLAAALGVLGLELFLGTRDLRGGLLVPLWLLGIIGWVAAWLPRPTWRSLPRGQLALLALVGLSAGVLRLYRLGDFQPLQIDEWIIPHLAVGQAREGLESARGLQLFALTSSDPNASLLLDALPRVWLFDLAGVSFTTMRLPTALAGTLEVVLVFLLGQRLFGVRAGLTAAAVLATLTVHLSFSRHGLINLESSLVWTIAMLLVVEATARRSARPLAIAGVVLGLGVYAYYAARPALVAVPTLLVLAALDRRLRGRWLAMGAGALAGGCLIGIGPRLVTFVQNPGTFAYASDVTRWLGISLRAFAESRDLAALGPVADHLVRAFFAYDIVTSGDNRYFPDRGGLFMALPAALLFAGVALTSLRLADWRYRLLAVWFWAPTIGLSAIIDYAPTIHRLLPVLPACALLIGLAFDRLVAHGERLAGSARRIIPAAATAVMCVVVVQEASLYFGEYGRRDRTPEEHGLLQHVFGTPPGQHVAVLPGTAIAADLRIATDGGRRNSAELLHRPADQLPETRARPAGVAYLIPRASEGWLGFLRDMYPSGVATSVRSPDPTLPTRQAASFPDGVTWVAYTVSAEAVEQHRGLRLTARDASGRQLEMRTSAIALGEGLQGLTYPVEVEWRGWLRNPPEERDVVAFTSVGSVAPTVRLGSLEVDVTATAVPLPQGGQPVLARARLQSPADTVDVRWDPAGAGRWDAFPVDRVAAWPDAPRVAIDWLGADGATSLRREYDFAIADETIHRRIVDVPGSLIRYSGVLNVVEAGSYQLELDFDGRARLQVDGRTIWPTGGQGFQRPGASAERNRVRTSLSAGSHPVAVEIDRTEGGRVTLLWARGGEALSVVPISAFAPLAWP